MAVMWGTACRDNPDENETGENNSGNNDQNDNTPQLYTTPSETPEDAKYALQSNGYEVDLTDYSEDEVYIKVSGEKGVFGEELVEIYYCSDKAMADARYLEAQQFLSQRDVILAEWRAELEATEDLLEKYKMEAKIKAFETVVIGQKGTMIWMGTPAAISAAYRYPGMTGGEDKIEEGSGETTTNTVEFQYFFRNYKSYEEAQAQLTEKGYTVQAFLWDGEYVIYAEKIADGRLDTVYITFIDKDKDKVEQDVMLLIATNKMKKIPAQIEELSQQIAAEEDETKRSEMERQKECLERYTWAISLDFAVLIEGTLEGISDALPEGDKLLTLEEAVPDLVPTPDDGTNGGIVVLPGGIVVLPDGTTFPVE